MRKSKSQVKENIRIFETDFYIGIRLWETLAGLRKNNKDFSCNGTFCPSTRTVWEDKDGNRFEKFQPLLGEIHVARDKWDTALVHHECIHAALEAARAFKLSPQFLFNGQGELSEHFRNSPIMEAHPDAEMDEEELFCYLAEEIFLKVYEWLWSVNPQDLDMEDAYICS